MAEVRPSSCSASSEFGSGCCSCEKAFDGDLTDGWATQNEGVGAWIKVSLDKKYPLAKIAVMQRPFDDYFKDVSLEFSDGTSKKFTLPNTYPTKQWEEIDLTVYGDLITSDYVKISANSVYKKWNNGFAEIKVFTCATGKIQYLDNLE